jgi:hypothetical protein
VIASLVSALALASPAQAIGLTFNWSFNATNNFGTGAQLGLVSGTISGVQDNATTSSGLIATVLSTPDGQNQGRTFSSLASNGGGNITVSGGVITSVGLYFRGSNINSNDGLILGSGNFYPGYNVNDSAYTLETASSATTTFSPSATPVPFDFDPSFGVVALGGIWAGRKVIKKIKTSKKSV